MTVPLSNPPSADAESWRERGRSVLAPCYSRYSDLAVDRAEGAWLHTVDGRSVLDFGSGIAVVNLGHRHPAVEAAVEDQLRRLWHTSVTALPPVVVAAAEAIVDFAPEGLDQVFLSNSGAEAVEAALKLARRATGRTEVVAFSGGFHGRTYGALSLTASKARYHAGMGPYLPGVHHVTYPDCRHTCDHRPAEPCPLAAGVELERLFATVVDPGDVAAVVVEPILGEGGYLVPPDGFLPRLREICDAHGILLVVDEVQSGIARSGRNLAVEWTGTRPDVLCLAKALANGLPIGATVASREVMAAWRPGEHGSTFGGNPLACAAAIAVLDVVRREHLAERADRLGRIVLERGQRWQEHLPRLADVRGRGLMIGLELETPDGRPDATAAAAVRRAALDLGVLVLSCGVHDNVLRVAPPLTISDEDLSRGLDALEQALGDVLGGAAHER